MVDADELAANFPQLLAHFGKIFVDEIVPVMKARGHTLQPGLDLFLEVNIPTKSDPTRQLHVSLLIREENLGDEDAARHEAPTVQ